METNCEYRLIMDIPEELKEKQLQLENDKREVVESTKRIETISNVLTYGASLVMVIIITIMVLIITIDGFEVMKLSNHKLFMFLVGMIISVMIGISRNLENKKLQDKHRVIEGYNKCINETYNLHLLSSGTITVLKSGVDNTNKKLRLIYEYTQSHKVGEVTLDLSDFEYIKINDKSIENSIDFNERVVTERYKE